MATTWEVVAEEPGAAGGWEVVETSPRQDITPAQVWEFIKEAGKQTANQAPLIGATAGAMLGGAAGPASPLTVPTFAAAGGVAGEKLRQTLAPLLGLDAPQAWSPEGMEAAGQQGLLGALAEGGFGVFGKAMAPFKGSMTREADDLARLINKENIPMSPSTVNPTWASKTAQAAADNLPVVNLLTNRYRGKLQESLTRMAQTVKNKYSAESIAALEKTALESYEMFMDSIKAGKIDVSETLTALKSVYGNASKKAKQTMDTIFKTAGEGTELPVDAVKSLKKQLSTIGQGNMDVKRSVNNALRADLLKIEGGEAAAKVLTEADVAYRFMAISKKINNLIKGSMDSDGITEMFRPQKFESKYTPELRKSLLKDAPDIVPALDDLLEIAKASKADLKKLKSAGLAEAAINVGAGGIGALILSQTDLENVGWKGAALVPAALLSGFGARSLMRPSGLAHRVLTTGVTPPRFPAEALKVGGRAAVMNYGGSE